MSSLIKRARGAVAILAATVLLVIPIQASAAEPSPSSDTSLSVFTVNGSAVLDTQTVSLPVGTTEVPVVATTTNANAKWVRYVARK